MTDFTNFPIWANAGNLVNPLFINSGWVCGTVNPDNMNWWFNRTDNALLDLNTRVTQNTTDINDLTLVVNNINTTAEASGVLGVYVADSASTISKFQKLSAGQSNATVMKTFNHTVQASGDVHLLVGYEANIVVSPYQTRNCVGYVRLYVDNKFAIVNAYGSLKNGNPRAPVSFQGVNIMRNINANYGWSLIGQQPFPTYKAGDNVQIKLDAYLAQSHGGSIDLGFLKLVVIEMRAASN